VDRTLASLLGGRNQSEIARRLGADRKRVHSWANDQSSPSVQHLPALAEILDVGLDELTRIVAEDARRRGQDGAAA
jgi:transcriptional regulator with XRE-family HTH domain